jgi:ABC-2 type transport system ATP-binding protein
VALPVITVDNLTKDFAGEQAVRHLSFSVPAGRLFGLVGADGAGKTTLMRILATLLPPDGGRATVLGKSVIADIRYIRSNIGYMPQRFSLYGDLSINENINFFADIFGVTGAKRKERIAALLEFSRLTPFVRRGAGRLSGGMKQKLALCCALIHTPQLLLLDEPTTGVDPVSRREFWEILGSLRRDGVAIVLSTPYMDEAQWCDEVLFLHHGNQLLQGNPDELVARFDRQVYRVAGGKDAVTLHCPSTVVLPEKIESMYPSGGALHVVTDATFDAPHRLLEMVRGIIPGAETIERTTPGMEDLFFHYLSTRAAAHRGN